MPLRLDFKSRKRMTEEVPRKQLAGMKILVVEDEKGMAQVLRRGLEEDNHAVSLASEEGRTRCCLESTRFRWRADFANSGKTLRLN